MRFTKLAASLTVALGVTGALAQQTSAPDSGSKQPINLHVVVTPGENGKPIPNLPQSNFTVLDNGAPQQISSFRAVNAPAEPVKILIVVDAVNVDFQRVAYERQQIDHFLRSNDGRLSQPTALAVFTDTGTQIEPGFSTDGNALAEVLDKQVIGLRDLRRSAGFYGAEERIGLSLKTQDQLLARASQQPGRKFIIWVSTGWPLLSGPNIQLSGKQQDEIYHQVIGYSNALRRYNTTLYVVDPLGAAENPGRTFYYEEFVKGLKKPSQAVPGDLGVQVLAVQSGGRLLSGNNDLSVLLQQCFADASAFYEISYQPPPAEHPDEYHRIEVKVGQAHLTARALQGYYDQP